MFDLKAQIKKILPKPVYTFQELNYEVRMYLIKKIVFYIAICIVSLSVCIEALSLRMLFLFLFVTISYGLYVFALFKGFTADRIRYVEVVVRRIKTQRGKKEVVGKSDEQFFHFNIHLLNTLTKGDVVRIYAPDRNFVARNSNSYDVIAYNILSKVSINDEFDEENEEDEEE